MTPNDGNWHYVVGAFDGTNSIVYIDGLLAARQQTLPANITGQSVALFLGAYPNNTVYTVNGVNDTFLRAQKSETLEANATGNGNGRVLAGNMCEAAFWNGKALTPGQINALYNPCKSRHMFLRQPVSANVNQNSAFTNTVSATGSNPLAYQWYQNGVPRAGQTNASLILPNVQISDIATNQGWYVVVTNLYGSATSSVVTLTVNSVPTFTQDIANTNAICMSADT